MRGARERQRVGAYALVPDKTDRRDDTTDDARWFGREAANTLDLSEHARYGLGLLTGGVEAGTDRSGPHRSQFEARTAWTGG